MNFVKKRPKPLIFIGFGLISLLLSCCSSESVKMTSYQYSLDKTRTQVYYLDSLTTIDAPSIHLVEILDSTFLMIANELNNSIDVYDHKSGNFKKRFKFDRSGPEGIQQVRTLIAKNRDSIYVIGKFHIIDSKLINWNGDIINEAPFQFSWLGQKYNIINHMSEVLLWENHLLLSIGPLFDPWDAAAYSNSYSLEYKFNLSSRKLEELPVTFPESYVGKVQNFYSIVPSRIINDLNQIVISWPNQSTLDIRNINFPDSSTKKIAHLNLFGSLMNGTINKRTPEKQLAHALDHVLYTKILFDPYRKVYYRIASLPSNLYQDTDLSHWDAFGRNKVGVIILDHNFEIIGYEILEAETYNCYRAFVGKEGLFISKNNVFRENYDENKLEYDLFNLVDL